MAQHPPKLPKDFFKAVKEELLKLRKLLSETAHIHAHDELITVPPSHANPLADLGQHELAHAYKLDTLFKPLSVAIAHAADINDQHLSPLRFKASTVTSWLVALERLASMESAESDFGITSQDRPTHQKITTDLWVALENIRSAHNLGSILRICDCMGVEKLLLLGYTPPADHPKVVKTSMGSEALTSTQHFIADIPFKSWKNQGHTLIGLETGTQSVSLPQFNWPPRPILFFGNERFGLSDETLKNMDHLVQIPMLGVKNSLNISNAVSMTCYDFLSRRHFT